MNPENHFSSSETSSTPWDDLQNIKFSGEQPKHPNPDSDPTTIEKPSIITTSPNRTCNWYLREIENLGHMENLKSFITDATSRTYEDLNSPQKLNDFCTTYNSKISPFLTYEAKSTLKHYSGLGYKAINQVARGFWDYEILGRQTPEKLAQAQQDIKNLSQIITSLPPLNINLTAYRGTNLDTFRGYQVENLFELKNLEHSSSSKPVSPVHLSPAMLILPINNSAVLSASPAISKLNISSPAKTTTVSACFLTT